MPMPIYEWQCKACSKRFSALVGVDERVNCPACGSAEVAKLVSRFARLRGEDERIDEMADKLENLGDAESPTQMRDMMREMGRALDEDASDEMEEVFEADMEGKLGDDD